VKKLILSLCLMLPATLAHAVDGVVEINQAAALAGGISEDPQGACADVPGFPITLCTPGSYVLTDHLVVSSDTNAIELLTDDVHLDLNGFVIAGPSSCGLSACPGGSAGGIVRQFIPPSSLGGHRVTVSNGTIRGFGANCVLLERDAHVENLLTSDCGARGINVGGRSVVMRNRVFSVGLEGIRMRGDGSLYAHNTVNDASLRAGEDLVAIDGGTATAGNVCGDDSCGAAGRRPEYYLTRTLHDGSEPADPGVCDPGFHFATSSEIANPSTLEYDPTRGETADDSGFGGPTGIRGWVRSGTDSNTSDNCINWGSSSDTGFVFGFLARLGEPNEIANENDANP